MFSVKYSNCVYFCFAYIAFKLRDFAEGINVFHHITEVLLFHLHEQRGIASESFALAFPHCKDHAFDVFGNIDLNEEDSHCQNKNVRWDNITLHNNIMKLGLIRKKTKNMSNINQHIKNGETILTHLGVISI